MKGKKQKMEIFGEIQGKLRKKMQGKLRKISEKFTKFGEKIRNFSKIPANSDFFGSNYGFFC